MVVQSQSKDDFTNIVIDQEITEVQPMTGIVFWQGSYTNTDAISLEFSYMLFNDIVSDSGVYDWTAVEEKLADIASRNHQAIFRFRYTYVGEETSVPDYIKARPDYNETMGLSEDEETWFPDWTNEELKRFSLEFYTQFAARYDNDPRLAFVQVGFGLWAEYHIYDGPFELGVTFPSKEFQIEFFEHLQSVWLHTYWSVSIDASDDKYSPLEEHPEMLDIVFGLFDDSFMAEEHSSVNELDWNFFDRNRYQIAPAGGELNYYTNYDQQHVLDWPNGAHGESFESAAERFHISYMIGADQPQYQTNDRIKQASMATGYRFKIVSFKASADSSIIEIINEGSAPIYYDAYPAVNGVRATESLKYLDHNATKTFYIPSGGTEPVLSIESDAILDGQSIGFYGTLNSAIGEINSSSKLADVYPNNVERGNMIHIQTLNNQKMNLEFYQLSGQLLVSDTFVNQYNLSTKKLKSGMYILKIKYDDFVQTSKVIIR
jgi:hypothetical protein